jgi:hypothetical protein
MRKASDGATTPAARAATTGLRRQDREAGRPPRTLADRGAVTSALLEPLDQPADRRARERAAALRRREVPAEQLLNVRDAGRERRELAAGRAGQHAHQHLVADVGGVRLRQRRQRGDGVALVGARQAAVHGVLDDQHPPRRRQGHAREQRRRLPGRGRPAIDEQATVVEAGDADARAQPAAQPLREQRRAQGQAVPLRERAPDRQRELRARAEARMRRQHAKQHEPQRLVPAGVAPQRLQMRGRALDLGAFGGAARDHLIDGGFAQRDLGLEAADHETEAAVRSAERAGRVEKAQVQTPRRAHAHDRLWVGERGGGNTSREVHRGSGR